MKIPNQIKTRSVVFLLACMLIVSSVSVYYAFSASTPTSGLTDIYIEPPLMESSYIIGIYTAPSICYLKNGTDGDIETTGTFSVLLQAAINYLSVAAGGTGGKILIRGGSYTATIPMTIISGDIWIEGEGIGVTTINYDLIIGAGAMFYYGLNTWHFFGGIKNIFFNGNYSAMTNTYGIVVQSYFSDLTFQDCLFTHFDSGVMLEAVGSSGQSKIWNIWFERCLFEDNMNYGIYFSNANDPTLRMIDRVKISECHFYGNKNSIYSDTPHVWHVTFTDNTVQSEKQACINISGGGRQWIITDNHIFDCGIGANGTMAAIMVNGSATLYPDSWLIENNIIANHFTSAPVALNNSVWLTGTVRNFAIQNNYFYVASEGVRLSGLSLTLDPQLVIQDNVGNYNNTVTSWNMGFGAEPSSASYVIFKDSSYTYMMNGTTAKIDYSSTNTSKVFDFAYRNCSSGDLIHVKSGSYVFDNQIIPASGVTLEGEGNNTILTTDYTGKSFILISGKQDVTLRALQIRMNISETTYYAVSDSSSRTTFDHCYFMYGYDNILLTGNHTLIDHCFFTHARTDNIRVGSAGYGHKILYNYFTTSFDAAFCILLEAGGNDTLIEGNEFDTTNNTSGGSHTIYNECNGTRIVNNYFHDQLGTGGMIRCGSYSSHVIITGNVFRNYAGTMISLDANNEGATQPNALYCVVANNYLHNCSGMGIYLNGPALNTGYSGHIISGNTLEKITRPIVIYGDSWDQIIGNTIIMPGGYGIQVYPPTGLNSTNLVITHNIITDGTGSGIRLTSDDGGYCHNNTIAYNIINNCLYGIKIDAGEENNIVQFNQIATNCTTKIKDDGTNNVVRWNVGYKTEASGSLASCVNGTAIPHGMVTTPAVLTLCLHGPTAYNATMILCAPTILSVNATHIVIEFVMWETVTWTLIPVTAVEAQTVWWTAQTWNYP